ncbi:hypothetical protein V474_19300 [Novosphingobium barchaimii LL02]|uniref:Uncharacterized protein n=1 Tax=Novosphingobium barchaimii LL02 TaxID=1114963 RepID=A0A0J7XV66_9SPHN|nr:hypothetical protein V474_19300 [Novosphingobium barchaimii LL02]
MPILPHQAAPRFFRKRPDMTGFDCIGEAPHLDLRHGG